MCELRRVRSYWPLLLSGVRVVDGAAEARKRKLSVLVREGDREGDTHTIIMRLNLGFRTSLLDRNPNPTRLARTLSIRDISCDSEVLHRDLTDGNSP